MVESVADECKNPDDGPQNVLDAFAVQDRTRVFEMIRQLPASELANEDRFEEAYQEYSEILGKYQEQPHLLDGSLEELVHAILAHILDQERSQLVKHKAAKYLYQICKVRTFKAFQKYLPHEIRHLSFVLGYLERQDLEDWQNWETRFLCLLWLSILVLNPFDLSRLDSDVGGRGTMERIYEVCRINCFKEDTCTPIAAYLTAKFLIRQDVKKVYLAEFLDWAKAPDIVVDPKIGTLLGIACVLKHGKREDLLPYAENLANWILHLDFEQISKNFKVYKICIKISQRIGMVLLPPRIAKWRYQRGARSLLANVHKPVTVASLQRESPKPDESSPDEADDDEEVPAEIEEIIERLLLGLKGNATIVRWSSAKGIGRITNRLPKDLGDEVVSSVIELINPLEQDDAWHGACLALAELARRGLLLPARLTEIIPLLMQALVYDEILGYRNVGQNIRDAACYMCWAFARAFHPTILQPFVEQISSALLVTAVFDREINCRRAASAAFQESVGRLGNFPHGIDILTMADFFSVAVRSNAFLQISDFIAQFEEYRRKLIDHLTTRKINHWDTNIRELSAQALSNFSKRDPDYMCSTVLPKLYDMTETTDLNARHGATLAIGEIVLSLRKLQGADQINQSYINGQIVERGGQLVIKFRQRGQFKGMSGTYMKHGCASFIQNCSEAELPLNVEQIESWQLLLDESIIDEKTTTRELAVCAFSAFCTAYYRSENPLKLTGLIDNYIKVLRETKVEPKAQGIASALGALPKFMLELRLAEILNVIDEKTVLPEMFAVGYNHSEMRRDCIKALANIVQTVNFTDEKLDLAKVYKIYMRALEEYAIDNRGDIGSWVREAGIHALHQFLTSCPPSLLTAEMVNKCMVAIAKQSVERIDKIRAVAGKIFVSLIYHQPVVPHISHKDELKKIFPEDTTEILWLFPHNTFPLFIQLLNFPEYMNSVAEGLILSVGAPTESLHSCAAKIMNDYLKTHEDFIPHFGETVLKILQEKTVKDTLFMTSTFQFIAELLSSSTNSRLLLNDESSPFPEAIFTVVNDLVTHSKKFFNSIPVYCALMLAPRICKRVLSKLVMYLGMLCVNIRRETALKMYETLLVYGDQTCIPEENLDEVLSSLSEEKWDGELEEARKIRNQLCVLLGIKPPVTRARK
ncbi:tubulin-specific chaperone D [Wyeomyia smithii]|uniref:tubulin-specific chaperone D n=1 Tax=Wyeomyia smithii TaxID=174621 RepID=UPI002467D77F|nr:tubulin-specific chaperone D [Wyeomyia smithii]